MSRNGLPPIETDSEEAGNVVPLGVQFKAQEKLERVLTVTHAGTCMHTRGFLLDDTLEHVRCKTCNEALNPMFVLKRLAHQETKYHELQARYQDELARLSERNRCKCEHCGQMTRIEKK